MLSLVLDIDNLTIPTTVDGLAAACLFLLGVAPEEDASPLGPAAPPANELEEASSSGAIGAGSWVCRWDARVTV